MIFARPRAGYILSFLSVVSSHDATRGSRIIPSTYKAMPRTSGGSFVSWRSFHIACLHVSPRRESVQNASETGSPKAEADCADFAARATRSQAEAGRAFARCTAAASRAVRD